VTAGDAGSDKVFDAGKVVVSGLSGELSANSATVFTVDARRAGDAQLDVDIYVCHTFSLCTFYTLSGPVAPTKLKFKCHLNPEIIAT